MNRKQIFASSAGSIALVGCFLAMVPFVRSLNPTPKADAALPRINIENIQPGNYKIQVFGNDAHSYAPGLLLYKNKSGSISAWKVPVKNGAVGMLDIHWWRPMSDCRNFGPGLTHGMVNENLPITCRDSDLPSDWWGQEWRWDIKGKRLGKMVDDLEAVRGIVDGKFFVVKGKYFAIGK